MATTRATSVLIVSGPLVGTVVDVPNVVIGEITGDGWKLIHDPHPSRDGIVGRPTHCELVFRMMKQA